MIDVNHKGIITPKEIGEFFSLIWDNPDTRKLINTLSLENEMTDVEKNRYLLIKQFLKELGLDYYYELFVRKGITTNMLLNSNLTNL